MDQNNQMSEFFDFGDAAIPELARHQDGTFAAFDHETHVPGLCPSAGISFDVIRSSPLLGEER
jgi:hypothetical protein